VKTCTKCLQTKAFCEFNKRRDAKDGLASACRDCRKAEKKAEYEANREKHLLAMKRYREANPEKVSLAKKRCYENKKNEYLEKNRARYVGSRVDVLAKQKRARDENRERFLEKERETRERLAEKRAELQRKYYQENKDRIREYHRRYRKEKWAGDELYALSKLCRRRVLFALQRGGYAKKCKTSEMLGCSWEELAAHIESKFSPGMTWENRGYGGWHLDHVVPLASAQTEEELIALCHYTNLQPLWAEDNLRKGAKLL
jgi:hypothetical protein